MIQWLGHAGITTRGVEDVALMLNLLAERNKHAKTVDFPDHPPKNRDLRVGVANNLQVDKEVLVMFQRAVDEIKGFGYPINEINPPFWDVHQGFRNIKSDRALIAQEMFQNIDVLILPTIPTTTPLIQDADKDPQALSAKHTVFANYYGLPAVTVPSGFDIHGLPLGLEVVGKPWNENTVLQFAYQYQVATEYGKKPPLG